MATKKKYYQRKDGLFEVSRKINGKRVVFRGKSCREVDLKILEYREEVKHGRKFPVIADEWERAHEKEISESTRRVYSYAVKRLKDAFPGPAGDIRPLDVKRYLTAFEAQGRAAESVGIELGVMKMICSYAVLAGDIDVSPAAEVKKSRGLPKKKREALTAEQENIVKTKWDSVHFGLFPLFLLYTGMRKGEALALSYSDIDRKRNVIRVDKKLSYAYGNTPVMEDHTKSENGMREVPLLPPLARALPKRRVGLIFPGADGGFMRAGEVTSNWRQFCREAGLMETRKTDKGEEIEVFPITPHCLRHSYATICYEAGLDPRQAAGFLGDTPETLEKVYTHLRQDHKMTAAEKLAEFLEGAM